MSNPPPDRSFRSFGLDERILEAVDRLGFERPTPIQDAAIPALLKGRDVIGGARTGSGKTAAFGLPLLERLKEGGKKPRGLVLAPTRELALQVTEALRSFAKKLPLRIVTIYGGAPYPPQLKALAKGVALVVGTPGRVLDHIDRGTLDLSQLEVLVLDEADEMLRMGFLEDVEKVLEVAPDDRQVALFSATMPEPIKKIVEERLPDPETIHVESEAMSVGHIQQRAIMVPQRHKLDALGRLLASEPLDSALVFARTRAGCAEVADELAKRGLQVDALHGDLNQAARERVLMRLRSGALKIVIATDVAARGIDVKTISHVINLDLPNDAESYVHRIGRTGRAGREGNAISLITPREVGRLRFFQRALDVTIAKGSVPSDAEIANVERQRLVDAVAARTADDIEPGMNAMLEELLTEHDARVIAAAALAQLASDRGLDLEQKLDDQPPRWARQRPPERKGYERGDTDRSAADAVELFLPVGKRRGVRPGDLVGALTHEAGLRGDQIGRVTITEGKSFVRTTKDAAMRVLESHPKLTVRGKSVPISLARKREGGPPPRPAPHQRRRGKPIRSKKPRIRRTKKGS